jgi:peptidyl-prolyl cis-trans isomerase SurA
MRRLTKLLMLLGICFSQTPAMATPVLLDKTIAVVNNTVITQSELDRRFKMVSLQLKEKQLPLPPTDELSHQIQERLVIEKLMMQRAQETGVHVTDFMLDNALAEYTSSKKQTLQQLRENLNQAGISYNAFREDFRTEMTINQLQQRDIWSQIRISDQEIDAFLKSPEGQNVSGSEYLVSHIFLSLPESPTATQIEKTAAKANEIYRSLQAGADFSETAIRVSQGPQALNGGSLGWRAANELPSLFSQDLISLKKGEIKGPYQNASGFHIIKLVDKHQQFLDKNPIQAHIRHIVVKPNILTNDTEAKEQLSLIKALLNDGRKFEDLAKEYSHDSTSATQGGDLGWLSPNEMPPEFRQAVNRLQPGQISEPIKTEVGWQLIQLLDRKRFEWDEASSRLKAKNLIQARKFEEKLIDWQRQLLDEAYIEDAV